MPKGFTEHEKEIIHAKLLEKGKEFLMVYGIKKTSVEDLTRAAGISKGSFYVFYNTKEELFFEVLEELEKEIKGKLLQEIFKPGLPPKESFKTVLKQLILSFDQNPAFKIFNNEELEYMIRKLPPELVQQHMSKDDDTVTELYKSFNKAGVFIDRDPKVVSGILRALAFTVFHKKDIGEEIYPEVISVYIDLVTDYLVKE